MMSTPVVVRVIQCLRQSGGEKTAPEVCSIIGEPSNRVNAALHRLVELNLADRVGEGYAYRHTPENDGLVSRLLRLYEEVGRGRDAGLLVRGFLCQIPARYPFHLRTLLELCQGQGFDRAEVARCLEREVAGGCVRVMGVTYTRMRNSVLVPVYVNPLHFDSLSNQGAVVMRYQDRLEPEQLEAGDEEYYLVADYPPELSGPAREHMRREKTEVKECVQAMGLTQAGGWYWRLKTRGPAEDHTGGP